ncbi:GtrA family protein [Paenibacillus sp. CGMCC 1.18879]|uniref:GtrA family protein n=1 Tax=Paenibacillus sp. CGMCC 1.18879 TaxID=2834466 RepID=UPI001CA836D4|nr:GtrA family protein [Paenibacillus sp. CGMCC 1.18879]
MNNQSFRFIVVGVLNTIVGFLVFAGYLHFIGDNYFYALLTSHIIGVIHSYIWNNRWTFSVKRFSLQSVIKFILIYTITFIINYLLLSLFVSIMGLNKLIAQLISLFITTLISFFGHKYWSFSKSKNQQGV